jgi:nucleolar protein 53
MLEDKLTYFVAEPTSVDTNPYLEPVRKRKVHAPSTMKVKPSAAIHQPAVEVADAGASYNPTMQDHQALLRKAHKVEEDKIAERERINKQLEFRKELLEMDDDEVAKTDDDEEEDSDIHSDDDEETRRRKETRKKTRTERNRLRRAKDARILEERRKKDKALNKELHKLDEIQQMVDEIEQDQQEKAKRRQERQDAKEKAGLQRLGKYYVPKAPIEVQLTEELSESLRTLKVNC